MSINEWINLFACLFSLAATTIAAAALIDTKKTQKEMALYQRKEATIQNFQILQEQVLDNMVSIQIEEVEDVIEYIDEPYYKKIYDDYRVLIARCEHFAVGVKNEIYDLDTVDALAGEHLIILFNKFFPIINEVRNRGRNKDYYIHFEQMVNNLREKHNIK